MPLSQLEVAMCHTLLSIVAGVALAGAAVDDGTPRALVGRGGISSEPCLAVGYDHYSWVRATAIPDGDAEGVLIGPLIIPRDGTVLDGVILKIGMVHARTPDLAIRLCYDADGDGLPEASVALESYLARSQACVSMERYSCPAAMDGAYFFRDGFYGRRDQTPAAQGALHDPIDDGADVSFTVFDGLAKGGRFFLAAVDSLAGDTGTVREWTVYTRRPLYGAVR